MNLYSKISKKRGEESEKIAKSAMKGVTKRLIGVTMNKNPEGVDVSEYWWNVARGAHASKHGVVFISGIPGQVLDCRVKTLYCHNCHNCQIHQNDKMLEVLDALQMPS